MENFIALTTLGASAFSYLLLEIKKRDKKISELEEKNNILEKIVYDLVYAIKDSQNPKNSVDMEQKTNKILERLNKINHEINHEIN